MCIFTSTVDRAVFQSRMIICPLVDSIPRPDAYRQVHEDRPYFEDDRRTPDGLLIYNFGAAPKGTQLTNAETDKTVALPNNRLEYWRGHESGHISSLAEHRIRAHLTHDRQTRYAVGAEPLGTSGVNLCHNGSDNLIAESAFATAIERDLSV